MIVEDLLRVIDAQDERIQLQNKMIKSLEEDLRQLQEEYDAMYAPPQTAK